MIFLCIFVLLISVTHGSAAQRAVLSIDMEKQSYYEGESIYLFVRLTNHGSSPYVYDGFFPESRKLEAIVTAPNGKILPYVGLTGLYFARENYKLNEGETISCLLHITSLYPNYVDPERPAQFPFLSRLSPGEYTVEATYENEGILVSNTLSFRVLAPPYEEKSVFMELLKLFRHGYSMKITQTTSNAFEAFIANYEGSIYIPLATLYWSNCYDRLKDDERGNQIRTQLIKDFGDQAYALIAAEQMRLPAGAKEEFLKELLRTTTSVPLREYIPTLLKRPENSYETHK